jgi:hypothetical protein
VARKADSQLLAGMDCTAAAAAAGEAVELQAVVVVGTAGVEPDFGVAASVHSVVHHIHSWHTKHFGQLGVGEQSTEHYRYQQLVVVHAVLVLVQPNTQNNPVGWVAGEVAPEAEEVVEAYNLAGARMGFCSF